ncbi:hypothetical protein [Rhodococcus qingshengii]|uniref:hypothetical protein n=1 Tax=Rhodococcus qingshengii TaxID=334542 RepID=UPI00105FAAA5|nr:hypothetical protein [Rhodococcus qingshengii]UDF20117.1 hypothetical protein LE551_22955 [Rhodococcus qingshengii]
MTNDRWGRDTTQRVADAIRKARGKSTVQWLSDRTAELGHRVSRSRISDLERGDRGGLLGVAELIVLAGALDVPPVVLLYPGLAEEKIKVLPGIEARSWDALRWFTGEAPMAELHSVEGFECHFEEASSTTISDVGGWLEGAEVLMLLRRHESLTDEYRSVTQRANEAYAEAGEKQTLETRRLSAYESSLVEELSHIRRRLKSLGASVPQVLSPREEQSLLDDDAI